VPSWIATKVQMPRSFFALPRPPLTRWPPSRQLSHQPGVFDLPAFFAFCPLDGLKGSRLSVCWVQRVIGSLDSRALSSAVLYNLASLIRILLNDLE